jgi:hypothetical protein
MTTKKLYIHTAPMYKALIKMMLFLAFAAAASFSAREHIIAIWHGNPELNSFILAVFGIGVWLSLGSARKAARAAEAINAGEIEKGEFKEVETYLELAGRTPSYIANILVFIGLFGTFWGMLSSIGGISLIAYGADGLPEAMEGLATALSTSIFGLAGSISLSFLQMQAGLARRYLISHIEG